MFTSIIIPTRNAVHRLLYTLSSLNLQFAPFEEFEVIVVDNASTDGLKEQLENFNHHYPLRYYRTLKPTALPFLLNAGLRKAEGQMVILLHDSMIVPRDFVGTHQAAHAKGRGKVIVGGSIRRIYSVFYPDFSDTQQHECHDWLEQYPQIKRPHSASTVIPLLTDVQLASGLCTALGLERAHDRKREAVLKQYEHRLDAYRHIWSLFRSEHVSFERSVIQQVGLFRKAAQSLRQSERDMGRRLLKAGYHFECAEKLLLLQQEAPHHIEQPAEQHK